MYSIEHLIPLHRELGGLSSKVVHIAGSKGKGTTAFLLAKLLESEGFKVGLFSSPSIVEERERIRINGEMIPEKRMNTIFAQIESLAKETAVKVSEFERITLTGLKYFNEEACDYVVLEVGLGGDLDATNVIFEKSLCILTHIELEHTDILGDSIEAITRTKLGIWRSGLPPLITPANQAPEVFDVIDELEIPVNLAPSEVCGLHHPESVGLAFTAFEELGFQRKAEQLTLLKNSQLPGRMERLNWKQHEFILDGAHTQDSVHYVMQEVHILENESELPLYWAVHFLEGKNPELWKQFPLHETVWIDFEDPRAGRCPEALKSYTLEKYFEELENLEASRVVFMGSFRLLARVKKFIQGESISS